TLVLADGARLAVGDGDLVVSAMPWSALTRLLPGTRVAFGELRSSPIVSVYWQLPPGVPAPDPDPVVALAGGAPFHFLLRRPGDEARCFAMLSGGDRSFDGQDVATIEQRARAQLQRCWPDLDFAAATAVVRKEQHATFVAACGSDGLRPRPGPLPGGPSNLLVCGDWTATGLPATLEGAARSAQSMLAACGGG
ncbi:MAG: FAD-dependent oxidoreductase, partial [Planctomycetota bacterium]